MVVVTAHVRRLETTLATVQATVESLRTDNAKLAADNLARSNEIRNLKQLIDGLQKPIPVGEPGVFPITRVLARNGDTVERMAEREGTQPAVIYGLNPWLDGQAQLKLGQPIWIPIQLN